MSGSKDFGLTGATVATFNAATTVASVALGAAVIAGSTAVTLGKLTAKTIKAQQERIKREQEAAKQLEAAIMQQIIESRKARSITTAKVRLPVVTVPVPEKTSQPVVQVNEVKPEKTAQEIAEEYKAAEVNRKVKDLTSRLPEIKDNYQSFVDRDLLDPDTVAQAFQGATQALQSNDLLQAEQYLQALDVARLQAMNQIQSQQQSERQHLVSRLNDVRERLPQSVIVSLESTIDQVFSSRQVPSDADLMEVHNQVSAFILQADRIQEAAKNMVLAWQDPSVGYAAKIVGNDDGDVLVAVETHEDPTTEEPVNTVVRIKFNGQKLNLTGPHEETASCTARTRDALKVFQEQGYYLEWHSLDNEPVPEECRQVYSLDSVDELTDEPISVKAPQENTSSMYDSPQKSSQTQSY